MQHVGVWIIDKYAGWPFSLKYGPEYMCVESVAVTVDSLICEQHPNVDYTKGQTLKNIYALKRKYLECKFYQC